MKKEVGLVSKLDDSWKDMPGVIIAVDAEEEDDDDGLACGICENRRTDGDRKLWSCSECNTLFHEQCAQYAKNSLCKSVLLPVMGGKEDEFPLKAYCPRCLDTLQHSQNDVEQAVVEAKTISAFLRDSECPFFLNVLHLMELAFSTSCTSFREKVMEEGVVGAWISSVKRLPRLLSRLMKPRIALPKTARLCRNS